MKNFKTLIVAALLIMSCSLIKAQKSVSLTEQQKSSLLKTWYESPRESNGDTITFATTKHVNVTGKDVVGYEYSQITFTNANDFNVQYWTKAVGNLNNASGKWNYTSGSSVELDFLPQNFKNTLSIVELTNTKLKVVVKKNSSN